VEAFGSTKGPRRKISHVTQVSCRCEAELSKNIEPTDSWESETGEISWRGAGTGNAVFRVISPAVRAIVGRLGGESFVLGDVLIDVGATESNWAAISLVALVGKELKYSQKMLLVLAGRVANTNMVWNDGRTSVGNKWGTKPTLVEGIPTTITFKGERQFTVQTLDGMGNGKELISICTAGSGTSFEVGPRYKTMWYLISPR
jgi:hypothetical protein